MPYSCNIIQLNTIDSTNLFLEKMYIAYPALRAYTIVMAKSQSEGKGQGTNSWYSSSGKNLLFSLLLKPDSLPAERQFLLNIVISLAIRETLQSLLPQRKVKIKWPNDIYVEDRKIAGILIKLFLQNNRIEGAIAGIGINVNEGHFPLAIPNPTSLFLQTQKSFSVQEVFRRITENILRKYHDFSLQNTDALVSSYLQHMYLYGQNADFLYKGERIRAKINGITPFGQLILHLSGGGERICNLNELSFLRADV